MRNNHPMVPPMNHFQEENKNRLSLAKTISGPRQKFFCKLEHFRAMLWTKQFSPSQNRDFENVKVIGPEEMLILFFGAAEASQTKIGST